MGIWVAGITTDTIVGLNTAPIEAGAVVTVLCVCAIGVLAAAKGTWIGVNTTPLPNDRIGTGAGQLERTGRGRAATNLHFYTGMGFGIASRPQSLIGAGTIFGII